MAEKNKLTSSQKVSNSLTSFLTNHAKLIVVIFVVIIVVAVALAIVLTSLESKRDARFNLLLDAETEYSSLALMDSSTAEYASTLESFNAKADELVALGLDTYPGAKAQYLLADAAYENGNYQEAADMYLSIADAMSDSYMAQLCIMNAAACYDNLGNQAKALELYNYVFDTYGTDSAYAPKALFNAGRLYEAMGETDLAKASFEQLTGLYLVTDTGAVSEYARLAESHLITMN